MVRKDTCQLLKLGGDHQRIWAQKLEVCQLNMPLEHAKLLFEIHNRSHGEYVEDMGLGHIGLDGLAQDVIRAREKMQEEAEAHPNLSYDYIENVDEEGGGDFDCVAMQAVKSEPNRYGILRPYIQKAIEANGNSAFWDFSTVFRPFIKSTETYYWCNYMRTDYDGYDHGGFNHYYEVL